MRNIKKEMIRHLSAGALLPVALCLLIAMPGAKAQNLGLNAAAGNGCAVITWDAANSVDSVAVIGGGSITAPDGNLLSSPLVVNGLENGKLYAFEVYFHPTEWPLIDVGILYAIPGEPAAVRNLTATGKHQSVTLTWEPPLAGRDYTYLLLTGSTNEKITLGANLTSYTVEDLPNGVAASFRVVACRTFTDFPGKDKEVWTKVTLAEASDEVAATPSDTRSVKIAARDGAIVVDSPEPGELLVVSVGGQPVVKRTVAAGTTSVSAPKGIYFVSMGDAKEKVFVQ
ncbi:MAG: fibronectin type III domain-containing protein [Tannerellaceae bacterium]|jgi:hypothetical protein|nr:fibronectin type III domain-containing protein [Tannerellaceae bacterium]